MKEVGTNYQRMLEESISGFKQVYLEKWVIKQNGRKETKSDLSKSDYVLIKMGGRR